jgi:hypothetical protein
MLKDNTSSVQVDVLSTQLFSICLEHDKITLK